MTNSLISVSIHTFQFNETELMLRILPVLTNLPVSRSSSILRPSLSGLLSPIQEPSDSELGLEEIGKMNSVSIYRYVLIVALLDF